jgi:alkyl hydroperoxide reductase subunit D
MNLNDIKSSLPDYAKDLRLNLDSVLSESGAAGLDERQIRAVALASAISSRNSALLAAVEAFAAEKLGDGELAGVRAAAAIMAMTNVYYRFTHSVANKEYETLRAGLRMNVMANPGIDKLSFELAALAASAINGCGKCMDSHERTIREHGLSAQGLQSAVRIAAVLNAVAVALESLPASRLAQAA